MPNKIPAAGEAMPAPRPEIYYTNWKKARQLGNELSRVLDEIGDSEFAYIRPSRFQFPVVFGGVHTFHKIAAARARTEEACQ
ncbi:hypothetical protein [Ensifer canadensis]